MHKNVRMSGEMCVINIHNRTVLERARKTGRYRYIGRGSVFGNPYRIRENGWTRDQVIEMYRSDLRQSKDLQEVIRRLPANAILGCYCAPEACHGDVIMEMWKEMHDAKLDEEVPA
jgi:hypothetical protein